MKANKLIYGALALFLLLLCSCESYLDKKEKAPLSFDDIWTKREYMQSYLGTVWGHILKDDDIEDGHPYVASGDDVHLAFNRDYRKINNGTWSPSNVPYAAKMWPLFYRGIREANIFLANIDKCSDPNVLPSDIERWKSEARFVRAYMNFCLYRLYGSYINVGDEIVDFQLADFQRARTPLDQCANYIENEFREAMTDLPSSIDQSEVGRATQGMCLALIGRLSLYAARPLYNGADLYRGVVNKDGTRLFPVAYDAQKWEKAADANKALIDFSDNNGSIYELHKEANPYLSYQNVFVRQWNKEIIWGRHNGGYDLRVLLTPAVVGGTAYAGCGPTQEMVDAFAMDNGRYPITGYLANGSPVIDPQSNYSEAGFTSFRHPIESNNNKGDLNTYNMYVNREPRFYVSVLWSGAWWTHTGTARNPVFAYNGNSGPGPRHDYPASGYLTRKFLDPSSNSNGGGWGADLSFPVIRLAEIYLNYAEALNESNPSHPDILKYINLIRDRAGVPNIEEVYPEIAGGANQTTMRALIKRERQVELFFECHRFFDIRQWMEAEELYRKPIHGMNVMAQVENANITPIDFWQRTVLETRIFSSKHYLFPMPQFEMDRNSALVQNYGW